MIKRIVIILFAALSMFSLTFPWVKIETKVIETQTEFNGFDILDVEYQNIILIVGISVILFQILGLIISGITTVAKYANSLLAVISSGVVIGVLQGYEDRVEELDLLIFEVRIDDLMEIHPGYGCLICLLACLAIVAFSWVLRDDRK